LSHEKDIQENYKRYLLKCKYEMVEIVNKNNITKIKLNKTEKKFHRTKIDLENTKVINNNLNSKYISLKKI